jgi:hypothetical protein
MWDAYVQNLVGEYAVPDRLLGVPVDNISLARLLVNIASTGILPLAVPFQ